jgi:(p)ppGpp synthase/HD superfamily hydrolase
MGYSERFDEALLFAARLHKDQVRKGSEVPYVTHLLAVAALVGENGGDEEQVIAGLLHDAVEDQGGLPTLEEIRLRFGEGVAGIVAGCTDAETIPKPPWRERKEAYLAHLRHAPARVRLVSSADKLHNARAIVADLRRLGEGLWPRFNGGREGTLWYYEGLLEAFRDGWDHPLVAELERTVQDMLRLAGARP